MLFKILFGIDLIAALAVVYFFLWGVSDGTVSSFNIGIWLLLLAAVSSIVGGGWLLNHTGRRGAAIAVLLILAAPAFLFGLFVLGMIVLQPRWN